MIRRKFFFSYFLLFVFFSSVAQKPDSVNKNHNDTAKVQVKYLVFDDGDSIPLVNLPYVEVVDFKNPMVVDNMKRYLKLRRDVIRAYPYAKLAVATLKTMNDSLEKISKQRLRKKYIKKSEEELKLKFEAELKKLTVNQGKILIKLINRETGDTSYEIVKEMRGTFAAFFWQTMAKFFDSNLKTEYDPNGEDQVMESIVQAIERGEIPVAKKN
ncbi:MAG: DUF4294 domain-containing protein [Bacteroidia bacterium]